MKMPEAIARIARTGPKPPNEANADKPERISQIASNKKPTFLFMKITPFCECEDQFNHCITEYCSIVHPGLEHLRMYRAKPDL
jgi:hypothetical protein